MHHSATCRLCSPSASWQLSGAAGAFAGKTQNVVLIVSDGLRWQEVFTGADPALLERQGGRQLDARSRNCASATGARILRARRALLFPFLWGTVAKQGQIYGNQLKGSVAHVTNGKAFSYPGYNEMSTGYPNDAIDSNEFGPNPNATVFEWLNKFDEFHGRVAIYGTWDAYQRIFNKSRSGLVMQTGWTRRIRRMRSPRDAAAARTVRDHDAIRRRRRRQFTSCRYRCLDYVKAAHPRVLFVGYGETDNWAHQGRYDLVLDSAHRMDYFVHQLWDTMQAMPNTAAPRPSSSPPTMAAAAALPSGRSTASRRRARRTSGSR